MLITRASAVCVLAMVCVGGLLSAYASDNAEPSSQLRLVATKPEHHARLHELLRQHEAAQSNGRYVRPNQDYVMPSAVPPEAKTLLVPPWEAGLDATRLIPLFETGMAAVVLVSPEFGATGPSEPPVATTLLPRE